MRFDELDLATKQLVLGRVADMLSNAHVEGNALSLVHRIEQENGPVIFRASISFVNEAANLLPAGMTVQPRQPVPTGTRTPFIIPAPVAGALPISTGPVQMPRSPFAQVPAQTNPVPQNNKDRRRRLLVLFFLILLVPAVLLSGPWSPLFVGGHPTTPPIVASSPTPTSTTTTSTPPPTSDPYVCQSDPAVKLGKDAGGKIPTDKGTAHAQADQDENCEIYFTAQMHGFVAQIGWIIEEQRPNGEVFVWVGDGFTIVNPHQNILTFVEFYGSTEAANAHVEDAAADWHTELGIPWNMIHVKKLVGTSLNIR